jgi:hypothetical protein
MRKARLTKELRTCEQEMEAAFKLQLKAEAKSQSERFVLEKLESLGKRKQAIEATLIEAQASTAETVSLSDVRQDLEERVHAVTRGWSKLPATHQRRALRRLIQKMAIGPSGLDIYYYTNATEERFSKETQNPAEVLPFAARGNRLSSRGTDSKLQVQNCTLARMVIEARLERATYCLEGSCSIQLSYSTRGVCNAESLR